MITLTAVIVILASIFVGNAVNNANIGVSHYVIRSPKLPKNFDGYKIAFISDYHNASFYDKAIEVVRNISPDSIIFVGDMINVNEEDCINTKSFIKGIKNTAPMYMVTGNHEIFNPEWKNHIEVELTELGVKVLDIDEIDITRGRESIHIYGMQDPAVSDKELAAGSWVDTWADMAGERYDPERFNILLCHRANYFPKLSQYGYELVLAGHLHGGLWRLPMVGGVVSPDRETLFPKYTDGKYTENETTMIVSRGCDKDKTRTRLFNQPEIVEITLRRGE